MKSLIKNLLKSEISILIRNSLNIKPISIKTNQENYPTTVSDAFLWRTDKGYKTKFKYSDILNFFYKIKNSWVELHFYNKNNQLLKIEKIESLNLSNELEITSEYLNDIEDYGVFYIYHFSENDKDLNNGSIISNRCYLGFSYNNNLHSFIHGNILVKFTSVNSKQKISTDIVKTSLFNNQIYTIQKYFNDFDNNELFFVNPTSKIIEFSLENKKFRLNPHCTMVVETQNSIISIKSNCLFIRPTIFSYKGKYMDVHHS